MTRWPTSCASDSRWVAGAGSAAGPPGCHAAAVGAGAARAEAAAEPTAVARARATVIARCFTGMAASQG